jgi:hypothetical protein
MNKIKVLKKVMDAIKDGVETKVLKSIPIRKEWATVLKELKEAREALSVATDAAASLKKKFWATIELDLNDFETDKRYNEETNEIEILEGDEE